MMDLEDIAGAMNDSVNNYSNRKSPKCLTANNKEVLITHQVVSLNKEVYRHIDTHLAVKLCCWTKH